MGKVVIDMSMSLDGFIAGPHDSEEQPIGTGGEPLHHWLFQGNASSRHSPFFKLSPESRDVLDSSFDRTGAILTGRRTFDVVGGWGGSHPAGVPVFVLTHHPPVETPAGSTPFTFVTAGIESAVRQAKASAGTKNTGVAGASTAQQCLAAGLVDELHIHLVPVLLGEGVKLFQSLPESVHLEIINTIEAPGVTHLFYKVEKVIE